MLKRILLAWLAANFVIAGLFALFTGGWYLHLPTFAGMAAELGLIMLPNLLFPILLLRFGWPAPISDLYSALGWQWKGWRPILFAVLAFIVCAFLSTFFTRILGPGISYNLPGQGGPISGPAGLLALLFYIIFVVLTVVSEETMFRGLVQTQTSEHCGVWAGLLLTIVLFGLRHLPADIFFSQIWHATPRMWLAREVDLYLGAVLLSLARFFGRSTYASATMHFLIFMAILVQGFL